MTTPNESEQITIALYEHYNQFTRQELENELKRVEKLKAVEDKESRIYVIKDLLEWKLG